MEHTEKVIEEMLENLLHSDDDVESFDEAATVVKVSKEDLNGPEKVNSMREDVEQIYGDSGSDLEQLESAKPSNANNLTIAEELQKMREEYPMSSNSEVTLTTPSTIALKTTSASIAMGGDGDVSPKTSSSKISYDAEQIAYRNEVSRVLFASKTENCPAENTPEYYAAAQEYAVYGNDFMKFLPDFEQLYSQVKQNGAMKQANDKVNQKAPYVADAPSATPYEDTKGAISQKSRYDFENSFADARANISNINSNEQIEQTVSGGIDGSKSNSNSNANFHNYPARAPAMPQKPLSAVAAAGAVTAATYYQLCSNLQRPSVNTSTSTTAPTFNTTSTATAAVNANILLNNNVPHAPSFPPYQAPVFQHQQMSPASNINQTAYNVASSNVRFASNAPLLPLTVTSPASSGVNVGTVNVYDRMVYAQLLQQQLIKIRQQQLQQQQQQQAIAAATIFQQQLQRQQQLKMAAAIQHVANVNVANANVATSGVDLTANVNIQGSSPNPQVVNFSATLTSSQSCTNSSNKQNDTPNLIHGNCDSSREGKNGPN